MPPTSTSNAIRGGVWRRKMPSVRLPGGTTLIPTEPVALAGTDFAVRPPAGSTVPAASKQPRSIMRRPSGGGLVPRQVAPDIQPRLMRNIVPDAVSKPAYAGQPPPVPTAAAAKPSPSLMRGALRTAGRLIVPAIQGYDALKKLRAVGKAAIPDNSNAMPIVDRAPGETDAQVYRRSRDKQYKDYYWNPNRDTSKDGQLFAGDRFSGSRFANNAQDALGVKRGAGMAETALRAGADNFMPVNAGKSVLRDRNPAQIRRPEMAGRSAAEVRTRMAEKTGDQLSPMERQARMQSGGEPVPAAQPDLKPGQMRMVIAKDGFTQREGDQVRDVGNGQIEVTRQGQVPAAGETDNTVAAVRGPSRESVLRSQGYNLMAMDQGSDGRIVSIADQQARVGRVPGREGVLRRRESAAAAAARNAAAPQIAAAQGDVEAARIAGAAEVAAAREDRAAAQATAQAESRTTRQNAQVEAAQQAQARIDDEARALATNYNDKGEVTGIDEAKYNALRTQRMKEAGLIREDPQAKVNMIARLRAARAVERDAAKQAALDQRIAALSA